MYAGGRGEKLNLDNHKRFFDQMIIFLPMFTSKKATSRNRCIIFVLEGGTLKKADISCKRAGFYYQHKNIN